MVSQSELQACVTDSRRLLERYIRDVEECRAIPRSAGLPGVYDQVLASHVTRMFLSCRNALDLIARGAFYDAAVICRAAIETLISITFIDAQPDRVGAAYKFVYDGVSHLTQKYEKLKLHYAGKFLSDAEQDKLQEKWNSYIQSLDYEHRFFDQLAYLNAGVAAQLPQTFNFLGDLPYAEMSQFVHPRPAGLGFFAPETGIPYKVQSNGGPEQSLLPLVFVTFCASAATLTVAYSWGLRTVDRSIELAELHTRIAAFGRGETALRSLVMPEGMLPLVVPKPKAKEKKNKKVLSS